VETDPLGRNVHFAPAPSPGVRERLDLEAGPVAVGTLVGLAGLLFLSAPVVDPVPIGSLRVHPLALSVVVLAVGFALGTVVFYRRGQRLFAFAHGIFGLAWVGIAAGTAVGSGTLVIGAVMLVVAGCGFFVSRSAR